MVDGRNAGVRRRLVRVTCLLVGASMVAAGASVSADEQGWRTFVLERPNQVRPARPAQPSRAALAEVARRQQRLTTEQLDHIRYWDEGAVTHRWVERLLQQIAARHVNPVRASRAIALMTVAMHDATIATWDAKAAYRTESPVARHREIGTLVHPPGGPSFPSEHAAVAAAAAAVLSDLFPGEQDELARKVRDAAESRVLAGVSSPADVEAGLAIGKSVGALVVARGRSDDSTAVFKGTVPVGEGFWAPIWPWKLLEPAAGSWRPWILRSGDEILPPPPPVFGSVEYLAEVDEIAQVVANLTEEQKAIANYWADGMGTVTPPGHWLKDASVVVDERFRYDAPQATRTLALLGISLADAFIACWNAKYTYWTVRPDQILNALPFRDLEPLSPAWTVSPPLAVRRDGHFGSYIRTPPFPGYPSGHATQSGAAAEVLGYVFPDLASWFWARAEEAALSRLYAGIHFSSDNVQGLAFGREVGRRVIEHVRHDEVPSVARHADARAARRDVRRERPGSSRAPKRESGPPAGGLL
jgi:membrane-associated phospholipid phosphatase